VMILLFVQQSSSLAARGALSSADISVAVEQVEVGLGA